VKSLQADHGATWVDFDNDGDVDLALTGSQASGMHSLLANTLSTGDAARSFKVRVVDERGRATRAGAEVRVFATGTTRIVAARLVDSGSGYDAQNDIPVHIGLAALAAVDVEVVFPRAGHRQTVRRERINPASLGGKPLVVSLK
jgi:hypothetical protein